MASNSDVDTTFDQSQSFSIDVDEEENDESHKQNGYATLNTDRYGFTGGAQYTSPEERVVMVSVETLRKRELKWLDMLENWEKWMSKRFKKVKERCRKGIPASLRARAWQYLCGSKFLMEHNRGKFETYLAEDGESRWIDDIKKDLHRQFPFHELFAARGGHGQEDLFRVLKAYTIHNPVDGYCQAQGPIAAVLLMHMPAEQAFWCLVSICEKYLPGYYSPGLEAVQVDGDVLFGLLKKVSPTTYKHLKKQKVDPILYMTEWFMCIYARTLPWATVLRVWDMFFCEGLMLLGKKLPNPAEINVYLYGVKVMFRVALVIFKYVLSRPDQIAECPTLYEIVEQLRHLPPYVTEEEFLSRECGRLLITERDMEKEHQSQLARRRAMMEKANKQESPSKKKGKSKKKGDDS